MRMSRLTVTLLAVTAVMLLTGFPIRSASAAPPDKVKIFVAFENPPKPFEVQQIEALGGKVKWQYKTIPVISVEIAQQAVNGIQKNPNVAFVEPDIEVFLNDAELDNTWGVKRIHAGQPHLDGHVGTGVKVGVIDSGIDYTHPELASCYAGGYDFRNNDNDPIDDRGHGTHVAGTIAAAQNGTGVVGVAPSVQLYALKVFSSTGSASYSDVIAAVEWCMDHGIQVTSNSYGSSGYPGSSVKAVFENAAAAGIINVASAGNSGNSAGTGDNIGYPAKFPTVIAVGATNSSDSRASFSSTGSTLELVAPGQSIKSTVIGGGYENWSGTSMACPHVSGAAAVLCGLGITDTNGNGMISDEVRDLLSATAQDLGDPGQDTLYGNGLIDLEMAVLLAPVAPPEEPPAEEPPPTEPPPTEPPPTEPPPSDPPSQPITMTSSIVFEGFGGKNNDRHLNVLITVHDVDGNPVVGASITALVECTNGYNSTFTGVTDSSGLVIFAVKNAGKGTWKATILELTAAGYQWDGQNGVNTFAK